jgi:hypothetical protein
MIAARLHDEKGPVCLMLVLEPGNIEKLKAGQPIHKWLNEFIPELPTKVELLFAYYPGCRLGCGVNEGLRRGRPTFGGIDSGKS